MASLSTRTPEVCLGRESVAKVLCRLLMQREADSFGCLPEQSCQLSFGPASARQVEEVNRQNTKLETTSTHTDQLLIKLESTDNRVAASKQVIRCAICCAYLIFSAIHLFCHHLCTAALLSGGLRARRRARLMIRAVRSKHFE